jgi:hypothetical protein
MWVKNNAPDVWSKTKRIMFSKDFVRHQLTGDFVTDIIEAEGSMPSPVEAAEEVHALLNTLFPPASGDSGLYLEQIQQINDTTHLRFGYQVNGMPVRFANGQTAALVTLSGTAVSSITLNFRQYTTTGNQVLLLPLRQALAVASDLPEAALSIGYVDQGSNSVRATWLAD